MALQITNTIEGKTANYWEIVQLYYNVDELYLVAELRGYESKVKRDEAKTGVKTALITLRFSISGADFPDVNKNNLIKTVETFIKNSPLYGGWSGAIIV